MTAHWGGCPQGIDPSDPCLCDELEEQAIQRASRPKPADLIKQARDQGLLPVVSAYF